MHQRLKPPAPIDRHLERLRQAYLRLRDTLPQDTHTQERLYQAYRELGEQARDLRDAPLAGDERYRIICEALRREAGG